MLVSLNPVTRRVIAIQMSVLAVTAPLYPLTGLSIAWRTALPQAALLALLLGVWAGYAVVPPGRNRAFAADTLLATFLLVLFTSIGGPAQYAGIALGFPLIDPWLASADASLGIHVRR